MDAAAGSRLLSEADEATLEEVLADLRTRSQQANGTSHTRYKLTHLDDLDRIQARHLQSTKSSALSISGRHLPLLYHFVSQLLSPPHSYAVLLIDIESRFDATRLTCPSTHLRHLYVQRPARSAVGASHERLKAVVAEAEEYMLHGESAAQSRSREWWGTIVVGAALGMGSGPEATSSVPAGDVAAGWKGWLRVEREMVGGFAMGISVREAWDKRDERQRVVDGAGWTAESPWGGLVFPEA